MSTSIAVSREIKSSVVVTSSPQVGISVEDLCWNHGVLEATLYKWRTKYADLRVSDVKKLRQLEEENRRLKHLVAEQALDIQALKVLTAKQLVRPKVKRTEAIRIDERCG